LTLCMALVMRELLVPDDMRPTNWSRADVRNPVVSPGFRPTIQQHGQHSREYARAMNVEGCPEHTLTSF
jgi:hypothetical protein